MATQNLKSIAGSLLTGVLAIGAVAIAAPAEATTFKFEWDRSGLYDIGPKSWCSSGCTNDRNNAGLLVRDQGAIQESIVATYDDVNERLTWEATYSPDAEGNNLVDGGWLVLTDGPAPKSTEFGDHAIFYMDAETGRLSAYAYTGENNNRSWQNEDAFIQSWDNVVNLVTREDGSSTMSFSIDASNINNQQDRFGADWKGTGFGPGMGVWGHARDASFTYDEADPDKKLTSVSIDAPTSNWFDSQSYAPLKTTEAASVPEPSMPLALGSVFIGGALLKRKRQAEQA
ncbi:MAG: PEP-CTERM sorting domain-containing protein [Cyanobacteria bacterium P01_D01_bin.73]